MREDEDSLRHCFILAFYFLLRVGDGMTYEESLRLCIQQGGATDTNACVVGGIIGAAIGVEEIPETMR